MTDRSVHQNLKTLEEAVQSFIADAEEQLKNFHEAKKAKDGRQGWHTIEGISQPLDKLQAALDDFRGTPRPVPRKPYVRTVKREPGRRGEMEETHESYGLVAISRVSGSRRFFGSSVQHQHYFTLKVLRGRRVMTEFHEAFYEDHRGAIVEVALTAAQFVEMITSMNMGSGVPCTIEAVEGVRMDATPEDAGTELKLLADGFEEQLREVVAQLDAAEKSIETTLAKPSINKADREAIKTTVHNAVRILNDSAPSVLRLFGEHTEKMVAKGKMEIESFVQLVFQRAGIKALKDSGGVVNLLDDGEKKT